MLYELRDAVLMRSKGDARFELHVHSLEVGYGEFNFIVGESGCGKSTLMDGLGLLLKPARAEKFSFRPRDGGLAMNLKSLRDSAILRLRRCHFGFVLQSGGLISSLTIKQNIMLSSGLANVVVPQGRENEVISRLGLERCLTSLPGDLSGGQRQRVAIARAVMHAPSVILADEPTAAVDQERAYEICQIFRDLVKEFGSTALMITHNRGLAENFADRILQLPPPIIHDGISRSEISWI